MVVMRDFQEKRDMSKGKLSKSMAEGSKRGNATLHLLRTSHLKHSRARAFVRSIGPGLIRFFFEANVGLAHSTSALENKGLASDMYRQRKLARFNCTMNIIECTIANDLLVQLPIERNDPPVSFVRRSARKQVAQSCLVVGYHASRARGDMSP